QKANDINYNKESAYDRDQLSIGLNLEYIGNWFVFNSATGYQNMDDIFVLDQDFSPKDYYFINQDRLHHTLYQEFNIHSKTDANITWLFGSMIFKQMTDKDVQITYGKDFYKFGQSYIKTYDLPTTGFALYGQSTVPFGKFNFTGGLRLDIESANLDFTHTYTTDGVDEIQPGFERDLNFDQITPKVSLAYIPNGDFTAYFTTTKGFKAGGFNFTFEDEEHQTYDPETSWNYEFGIKSTWFNKQLTTNLSLFHIDIDNQQVAQPVPSGQGSMTKNAGVSQSRGIEFETNFVISNDWQLWASFGYTEAKFTEYTNTKDVDLSGKLIPNVPKYTFGIGTDYTLDFQDSFIDNAHFNLSYQHIGKMYWD
ncbi:MAG: TonB-dependent receptor, partial [candidate division Zixibacteria bacterium]|nr:TonB-dependent receptor [candidate division Zixibacteria bacterium]